MNPISELASGGWILSDWLGKGARVVDQKTADDRASICVTCPENRGELWWERMLKDPIADMMRKQLELKNHMALRVSVEDKIHVCAACGCLTRLKVWADIQHIKDHTPPETMEKFVPNCWIRKEIATPNLP